MGGLPSRRHDAFKPFVTSSLTSTAASSMRSVNLHSASTSLVWARAQPTAVGSEPSSRPLTCGQEVEAVPAPERGSGSPTPRAEGWQPLTAPVLGPIGDAGQ